MSEIERDVSAELANFAEYSRAVARDAVGQARQTWFERAEWADACAAAAEGAVDALEALAVGRVPHENGYDLGVPDTVKAFARLTLNRLGGQRWAVDDPRLIETFARVVENRHGTLHGIGSTLREALAEYKRERGR